MELFMVKKTLWWDILQNAVYEVKKSALHILLTSIFDGRRCSIKGKIYTKILQ